MTGAYRREHVQTQSLPNRASAASAVSNFHPRACSHALSRRISGASRGAQRLLLVVAGLAIGHLARPAAAEAGTPEPTLRLIAIYGGAAALDELSTEYALHNNPNAREGNVLLRSRPLRVGAHVGVTALETWATRKLQREGHPGWARALKWGVVAKAVVAGVINIRAARAR